MDETPDRPTASGDGDPPPTPPTSPTPPPDDPDDHTSDLPPLPDLEDPPARRALSPRRLFAAVGVVAVVAVVGFVGLTGGGGDGDDDDSDGVASIDGADGESADGDTDDGGGGGGGRVDDSEFQDAMLEFAECMREHGIDMPDPEFDEGGGAMRIGGGPGSADEGGPSQEEFEAADEACSPIMEDVRPDIQLTPEEQAELQDEMVAVAQCMRDKGWNMPDPEVGESGEVRVQVEPGDETSGRAPSPENQEAHMEDMEACQEELGIEGRGPGGPAVAGGGDT
jgi:hypothetical protein